MTRCYTQSSKKSKFTKLITKRKRSKRTEERERILSGVRPIKISKENITPYELDIIKRDQYDRKIREIEIRARNIKRRQRKEEIWKRGKHKRRENKGIGTVDELLQKNKQFSNMLKSRNKKKRKRNIKEKKITSIKQLSAKDEISVETESNMNNENIVVEMDFSNTQKLNLIDNEDCRNILKLFYSQSKQLIQEMRDRMTNSQSILKLYMDKLETVIKGDSKQKYLQEDDEQGFVTRTILKEQRIKYRKLHCINGMEKRLGVIELFKELSRGCDQLELVDYNTNVDQCDSLNEEGKARCGRINNRKEHHMRSAG